LVDAGLYVKDGDLVDAGISLITLIPFADALRFVKPGAKAAEKGSVLVYRSITAGKDYVGITSDITRRAAAHLGQKGIQVLPIKGLENLTRADARAVEQVLIQEIGGPKAKGVLNLINSIATSNPIYADAILRGCALLLAANYAAPKTCS
jgi:filamentous hemagglutinin